MSAKTPITKLDLWVAGTMFNTLVARSRVDLAGVSWEMAIETAAASRETPLMSPLTASRASIVDFFGPPTREANGKLLFDLALWPEHEYEWGVAPNGKLLYHGFLRRSNAAIRPPGARSLAELQAAFTPWLHTSADIVDAMGPAAREDGWWPEATLFYVNEDTGREIALTFDHGLLCAIAEESS